MTNPHARLKHRSNFNLYSINGEGDPFNAAAQLVIEWVVQKELAYGSSPVVDDLQKKSFPKAWNYFMPEDYRGGDYEEDRWPALACMSWRDEEGNLERWIVEYDEPDASHDDRRWHTTVCLERGVNESCLVQIESVCRPLFEGGEPLPETIAAPALVRNLIDLPWYVAKKGSTQLQTVPHKMSGQTFEHFKTALLNAERECPLVLFCTGYDGKIPEAAKQLARRALGTANVYVLDFSNDELREKVQELFKRGTPAGEYNCPRSSCRMYLPGIDLTDHNKSMSHESWNREMLQAIHPSKFAETLARRFIPNTPVPTIASVLDETYVMDGELDEDPGYDGYEDSYWADDYDRRDDRW